MRKRQKIKKTSPKTPAKTPGQAQKETDTRESGAAQTFQNKQGHYFLFFLIIISLAACYFIIRPYLNAIILATILAILVQPVYRRMVTFCRGRRSLAAFLTCTLLTLVVLLPLLFMLFALIQQGVQSFNAIYDWIATGEYKAVLESSLFLKAQGLGTKYLPDLQKFFPDFNLEQIRLDQYVLQFSSSVGKNLLNQGTFLLGNLTSLIAQFFLLLFTFFFMVRDQEQIIEGILHLVPLSNSQEREILDKIQSVAKSAILGTFITAVAQGVAGGIALHIAGLPGLFWGAMMAFASLVPLVGTALIWIPAAAYLLLAGHWGYALFLTIWCVIFVGSIDNFVRPLFMKGSGQNMSTLVIFFSILGGINVFGLIGLLYGPLIVGLTMVFLYMYSLEFESFLNHQDQN